MLRTVIGWWILACFIFTMGCASKKGVESTEVAEQIGVGSGSTIALTVTDKRVVQSRYVAGRIDGAKAQTNIALDEDLANVIKQELIAGLEEKSFAVIESKTDESSVLSVELIELGFENSKGLVTGNINVKSVLSITARSDNKIYNKTYRHQGESRVFVGSTEKANQKTLQYALDAMIEALLTDKQLMAFLAQ